jgi:uncharacterized protein (DUF362 family)
MNRRRFIGASAILASTSAVTASMPISLKAFSPPASPDLVVHTGTDYFLATRQAIEKAGGIGRFVPENSSVGLLINSRFDYRSALVKPEITLAILDLVMQTHPRDVILLQAVDQSYWEQTVYSEIMSKWPPVFRQVTTNVPPATFNHGDFVMLSTIPGARQLKDVEVVRQLQDLDIFINVPQIKHHNLTLITGALKNMMGICTRKTNVSFHLGSGKKNDPGYLAECIADINLLRRPDLVVADATELIINNGPSGPGDAIKPDKILVSKDPVAIDAYGCRIMGFDVGDILSISAAYEAGLGEMNLDLLNVVESYQE